MAAIRSNERVNRRSSPGPDSSRSGSAARPARTASATHPVAWSSAATGCSTQRTTGNTTSTATPRTTPAAAAISAHQASTPSQSRCVDDTVNTAPCG